MTASSGGFELRGSDGDETRLLVQADVGYALAVPGTPRIITSTPTPGGPRYDVVLQLGDAPIEIGLRVDHLGTTTIERDALLASLATAYVQSRAADPAKESVDRAGRRGLAPGADVALRANYRLQGDDDQAMEYLLVTLRDKAALHLTVRYRRADITPFAWSNLRSVLLNHQSWTPGTLPSLDVWPAAPRFLKPSVAFELTPSAIAEAQAKAKDVGEIPPDDVNSLADLLLEAAHSDDAPTLPWAPFLNQHATTRVAMTVGSRVAEVLCRDIDAVDSMHDYRGWAWQCYWAVGNRTEVRERATN